MSVGRILDRLAHGAFLAYRRVQRRHPEQGDVPGWVLVTIMTAGLVTALWLIAESQLREIFTDALNAVVKKAP